MKQVFGILTALIAALLIIFMAQMIREGLYPQPEGLDYSDRIAAIKWMASLPTKAFIIIAISHGLASFAAGLISSLTVDVNRMAIGMVTASVIFIPVMVYLFTYSFPVWFVITDTIVTVLLGFIGVITGSARYVN
ncbi:MAG: hypothetical protein IPO92_12765 [Saprospiraceae bacterium]|nr:hypothetical protein [Saprospiraceae bacterium]